MLKKHSMFMKLNIIVSYTTKWSIFQNSVTYAVYSTLICTFKTLYIFYLNTV